jgi:hypothetical protein
MGASAMARIYGATSDFAVLNEQVQAERTLLRNQVQQG